MIKGDRNPSGSNKVAIFFKTFLLVGLNCWSIDLNLKVNTSSANQIIPSVFMA